MIIKNKVDNYFNEIIDIRRTLHQNPELSEQEIQTSKFICELLSKWGIEYESNIGGNGISAIIRGKKTPSQDQKFFTVGLRADIDALPITEKVNIPFRSQNDGVMHACGHDIHMAVLLGSAKILKEMENDIPGNVKLFFEQAEETVGGAQQMIAEGCLENPKVDAILGLHIAPYVKTGNVEFRRGKMNAASTEFEIFINGVSCHGAHPETGIDSIVTASNIVCALQSIINRNLAPTTPGVVTIGQIHGGSKNNIISQQTIISGIIRALDMNTKSFIKQRVQELSQNIARGFGAEAIVKFYDSCPALINNDEIEEIIEEVAVKNLGKNHICFLEEPSLGADDFSYFSEAVPSVYFNIGCLSEEEIQPQALHNEFLNPHEECIRVGMLMEINGVFDILEKTKGGHNA